MVRSVLLLAANLYRGRTRRHDGTGTEQPVPSGRPVDPGVLLGEGMIIAAVCLGKFIPSGQPINVPFGKGHDHGEAYATLLRFYNILESRADGFAASVGDEIVFLNREDAMKHALENDQVKPECRRRKRLNSEMLNTWERGEAYDRLTDMEYRMKDFYWI